MNSPTIYQVKQTPLPPFAPSAHCAKCGHGVVTTFHQRRGCEDATCTTCKAECLIRACQRCHYQWAEAVMSDG